MAFILGAIIYPTSYTPTVSIFKSLNNAFRPTLFVFVSSTKPYLTSDLLIFKRGIWSAIVPSATRSSPSSFPSSFAKNQERAEPQTSVEWRQNSVGSFFVPFVWWSTTITSIPLFFASLIPS